MLRVNLEAEGYETLLASDGATALRRIEEEKPDLVLLDIMMPIVDGWGVLDEVGSSDSGPRVIMLSAKAGEDDVLRAWRNGADEYVTKPFDPDRLMVLVSEVLVRSADERKARRETAIAQSAEASAEAGEP